MAQIIEFRQCEKSEAYRALEKEIEEAKENLTLYAVEMTMTAYAPCFRLGEIQELTEKIRRKRLEIAAPVKKAAEVADRPGLYQYTPEMGQQKPVGCQLTASRGFYGKHWFVDPPKPLKGCGISLVKRYTAADFSDGAKDPRVGWYGYSVTNLAFEKLKKEYSISHEMYLD